VGNGREGKTYKDRGYVDHSIVISFTRWCRKVSMAGIYANKNPRKKHAKAIKSFVQAGI
jgi:hypothetical protein